MPAQELLITCPGALGDLLYCLPLAQSLAALCQCRPHLATSAYCRPALELLRAQPYLGEVFIDADYQVLNDRFGLQPWRMSEPPGYRRILHLGLRYELVGRDFLGKHLSEVFALNLARAYGLDLALDLAAPCIYLPRQARENFLAFNGWGISLQRFAQDQLPRMRHWWRQFFRLVELPVVVVCGAQEKDQYDWLPATICCPQNLLETAWIINRSACFVGVESASAAVANGLKAPRLILNWFGNALPTGPGGGSFSLDQTPQEVAPLLEKLLAYRAQKTVSPAAAKHA